MLPRRTFLSTALSLPALVPAASNRTAVSIDGDRFFINGKPTYEGRKWKGHRIEGLLMNTRMVQGIYDDTNPATRDRWKYPDTGKWDAERNTREFIAAMPEWRKHGVLSFTINMQGGSPQGYSKEQPWINTAFAPDGALKKDYMGRLERILDKADQLGMVAIVGYFYFGQDERLKDETAVKRAVGNATDWLLKKGYRNILVEVNNECDVSKYDHDILKPERVHELVVSVKNQKDGSRRLLAGLSYRGKGIPRTNVVEVSDFLLLHGNGVTDPAIITDMVKKTRAVKGYKPMPILFNEDDHFDFDKPVNNMVNAIAQYASWGYFDPGKSDYSDGYQCPPVNWGLNTERKKAFFGLVKEITGA